MIIDSKNIEFGYELISVIPYANYLASKGKLTKTISGNDTECLYFFSPKHEINKATRNYFNIKDVNTPNKIIHTNKLDKSQFLPPDYKTHYANDEFKFSKETVVICNRYNTEWHTRPINFFSIEHLERLFKLLQDKYQVIYINIEGRPELYDNAPPESFGDFDLLNKYPKVINIHSIHSISDYSFNELQLRIFANCQKYITMNGGHAILAAYFGGENIIMSKPGHPQAKEITENVNSFYRWYNEFGGQRCMHVQNEYELLKKVKDCWIDCNPIVNVLVRTSSRPNYFKNAIESILNQSYKNINIIVSIDNENDYTIKYPVYPVFVDRNIQINENVGGQAYGRKLVYNLYFNEMYNRCNEGLVLFLDDDDKYNDVLAIEKVVNEYRKRNELIFWKVKIGNKVIPEPEYWMKEPTVFQINGTGMAFHTKYIPYAQWEPFKRGDFRVAANIYPIVENRAYIDEVLTCAQEGAHHGLSIDLKIVDKKTKVMESKVKIKIVKDTYKGQKLGLKIGEIIDMKEMRAKQLFAHGLAVPVHKDITEEKVIEYHDIIDDIVIGRAEIIEVEFKKTQEKIKIPRKNVQKTTKKTKK